MPKEYTIVNKVFNQEETIEADSAQEACDKLGWMIGNCWVKVVKVKVCKDCGHYFEMRIPEPVCPTCQGKRR